MNTTSHHNKLLKPSPTTSHSFKTVREFFSLSNTTTTAMYQEQDECDLLIEAKKIDFINCGNTDNYP